MAHVFYCEDNAFECDVDDTCSSFCTPSKRFLAQRRLSSKGHSLERGRINDGETIEEGRRESGNRVGNQHMKMDTFQNHFLYFVENRIAANKLFPFILIIVFFISILIVLSVGWMVMSYLYADTGLAGTDSFADSVFFTAQLLSVGGFTADIPVDHEFRRIWYYLDLFLGLIIFAVLIGFISESVNKYMAKLESGSTNVFENGHTLILGWNESTARVIIQIAYLRDQHQKDNEKYTDLLWFLPEKYSFQLLWYFPLLTNMLKAFNLLKKPSTTLAEKDIVILCNDYSKDDMHQMLWKAFKERNMLHESWRTKIGQNIICRVGDPSNIQDLLRVNAHKASAILVQVTNDDLIQEHASYGKILNGGTVRVALALRNTFIAYTDDKTLDYNLRIVMQMSNPSQYVDATIFRHRDGRDVIIPMDLSRFLNSLLFKSAMRPGLASVLLEIFNFHGFSFKQISAKDLEGGDQNERGHCCGLGKDGKKRTFREM